MSRSIVVSGLFAVVSSLALVIQLAVTREFSTSFLVLLHMNLIAWMVTVPMWIVIREIRKQHLVTREITYRLTLAEKRIDKSLLSLNSTLFDLDRDRVQATAAISDIFSKRKI